MLRGEGSLSLNMCVGVRVGSVRDLFENLLEAKDTLQKNEYMDIYYLRGCAESSDPVPLKPLKKAHPWTTLTLGCFFFFFPTPLFTTSGASSRSLNYFITLDSSIPALNTETTLMMPLAYLGEECT